MSLLTDASLVLVPSAIKTGEVLVQKPLPTKFSDETGNYDGNDPQGSANLTFTRNSNATRVNSAGKVEKVRTNLALQSQTFDNASWVKHFATITANATTAPDGTLTADKLIANSGYDPASATGNLTQTNVVTINTHTISLYAKAAEFTSIRFRENFAVGSFLTIDLTNGSITGGGSQYINPTATAVGDGWYRISFVTPVTADLGKYSIRVANTGDGTSGVFIWGLQFEVSDFGATPYIATTTSARSTFAGITVDGTSVPNVPRLDYSGGATCGKLLLEPQCTALNQYSEQLNNAYWSLSRTSAFGSGSVANAVTAPDGTQSAEYVQQATGQTSGGGAFRVILLSTGNYTISVFAKKAEQRYLRLGGALAAGGSSLWCNFDLETGTIGTPDAGVAPKIENYENGWFRCSITANKVDLTGQNVFFYQANTLNGSDATPLSGLYLWGANVTQTSYLQSYVPTLGASVTRLGDMVGRSSFPTSILNTTTAHSGFFELKPNAIETAGFQVFGFDDGSYSSYIKIYADTTGRHRIVAASGGISGASAWGVANQYNKFAWSYDGAGNVKLFCNGVASVNYSITLNAMTYFGAGEKSLQTNYTSQSFKQILLFNSKLTDAQLAELTTL